MSGPALRPTLRRGFYLVLTAPRDGYERITELAVAAGAAAVQLRPKSESDRTVLRTARAMRALTRGSRTLFIVNDRPDLAVLADADGVHLGQDDLPPAEARRIVGPDRLVGLSTHNLAQVRASDVDTDVDYIGFGPLFATNSKVRPDPVTGPDALAAAAAATRHPIVAIGGITPDRVRQLAPDAWRCVAAIRAVTDAADPVAALRAFQAQMEANP